MSKLTLVILVGAASVWSQQLDLTSLDKLAAKAKSVNRVNLDGDQLGKMGFSRDGDGGKKFPEGLKSVQVRNYEFDAPGQYLDSDLDAVRQQISGLHGWTKIVESKDGKEHSEIFMCSEGDRQGLAIISAEPKEISVVFIKGPVDMKALRKFGGMAGMPTFDEDRHKDRDRDKDRDGR